MALSDGSHGSIGGVLFRLDKNAPEEIGQPAYSHRARSIFRGGTSIDGKPGAQNLREDLLQWHITRWDGGEGQVVLENEDDASFRRFYRSEGLDFRVPGQVALNKSTVLNSPADASGGAASTSEGDDWSNTTGTSTVVNTSDRRINLVNDVVSSETHTPGASQVQVEFHAYREAQQLTTIEGSTLVKESGAVEVSGTDILLNGPQATVRTGALDSGSELVAGVPHEVKLHVSATLAPYGARLRVIKVRNSGGAATFDVITGSGFVSANNSPIGVTFTPQTGSRYQLWVDRTSHSSAITVDKITYGMAEGTTRVLVQVRNTSDNVTVAGWNVDITNTTSAVVRTMNFNGTAAKNYQYRVTYVSGNQRPVVDKAVATVLTTTPLSHEAMELGLDGKVWVVSQRAAADPTVFTYDFTNEDWDIANTSLADCANGAVCRGLTYSDKYMYGLFSDGTVNQFTAAGDNDYATGLTDPSALAICQNRLFVLTEDDAGTNGIQIRTYAVDADVSAGVTAALQTTTVSSAIVTADTTLRERMVGTPSGARFFVNYSDVQAVIYEADASGSATTTRELARLDVGAKATAIEYVAGLTFVAGQFKAETGQTPRSALWVIDQNSVLRRIGYFRRDDPTSAAPVSMQAYQNDLWILQGKFVWRYSLSSGGLFCEYQLDPGDESYARSIVVLQGHTFALFAQEDSTNTGGAIWVTGSVGTYRQASITDGNSKTSSIYDYGLPSYDKLLTHVTVITDTMPDETSVSIEMQFNQSGTWVEIGTHLSGSESVFVVSNPEASTTFKTAQVRYKLASADGVSTPTLKAVVIDSLPLAQEEFFDLMVLTEDEDSTFHIPSREFTGGDIAQALWAFWRAGTPVTFVNAFEHSDPLNNPEYLVRVEDCRHSNDELGEGRMLVTLRVL